MEREGRRGGGAQDSSHLPTVGTVELTIPSNHSLASFISLNTLKTTFIFVKGK